MIQKNKFGYFDEKKDAGYVITNPDLLISSWEYIYQNKDILLKVDQNGPVFAQAKPVEDILIFKRESNEKFSKWLIHLYVNCGDLKKHITIFSSRFKNPYINAKIYYSPHKVEYVYNYGEFLVEVNFMVPENGMHIISQINVINQTNMTLDVTIGTSFLPYINYSILPPWDKPEWYLMTEAFIDESNMLTFISKKTSPTSNEKERKTVLFQTYVNDSVSANISLEKYCGIDDFYNAQRNFNLNHNELTKRNEHHILAGYPAVYAYDFQTIIKPQHTFKSTQVITVFDGHVKNEDIETPPFLDEDYLALSYKKQEIKYNQLFNRFTIKTPDKMFNRYVNTFLPLQLDWVKNLDRGWPSGMRGVRDSSNDFMGILNYDPDLARNMILQLFSCQLKSGWLPRQVSANGKSGKHDLRKYNDGGVFLLEFVIDYLIFTNDYSLLEAKTSWLDSNEQSSILEHMTQTIAYYIHKDSIGIHGLIKIFEGDWLDAINKAGLEGIGESVTITMQLVLSLKQLIQMFKHFKLDDKYKDLISLYQSHIDIFERQINKHAYNQSGFYNGIFTDGKAWVFSDNDPDGESRIYMTVNAFAIISGVAQGDRIKTIINNLLTLKSESGYRLFSPALGNKKIDYLGRMGTGDQPIGLWENGTTYNHSSHGFFSRALALAKNEKKLLEVIKYMLPYDEKYHPVESTLSPPYAIVNCYQDLELFPHRGGLPFLTGTIAMAFRAIYNWMFGIQPVFGGVVFKPQLTKDFSGSEVKFDYYQKILNIKFKYNGMQDVFLNNKLVTKKYKCAITHEEHPFISYEELNEDNRIMVTY